ncbi:hypothetical protein EYF80_039845 [Liparis tanakae]|uniref:Uncharacterized protein n=1 Tax=Liparis tanakae TaxID=230148 RepID=A0A4Z2G8V0_9TELE|nr:hypothetical protein EYF80_039845 [Liparis tanakae]
MAEAQIATLKLKLNGELASRPEKPVDRRRAARQQTTDNRQQTLGRFPPDLRQRAVAHVCGPNTGVRWRAGRAVNSLLQQQDDVVVRLVGRVQVDHPGVVAGRLQHGHLVNDVRPAVAASPPLPEELGGEHFARGLLHAAPHHRELPPGERRGGQRPAAGTENTSSNASGILEQR